MPPKDPCRRQHCLLHYVRHPQHKDSQFPDASVQQLNRSLNFLALLTEARLLIVLTVPEQLMPSFHLHRRGSLASSPKKGRLPLPPQPLPLRFRLPLPPPPPRQFLPLLHLRTRLRMLRAVGRLLPSLLPRQTTPLSISPLLLLLHNLLSRSTSMEEHPDPRMRGSLPPTIPPLESPRPPLATSVPLQPPPRSIPIQLELMEPHLVLQQLLQLAPFLLLAPSPRLLHRSRNNNLSE